MFKVIFWFVCGIAGYVAGVIAVGSETGALAGCVGLVVIAMLAYH